MLEIEDPLVNPDPEPEWLGLLSQAKLKRVLLPLGADLGSRGPGRGVGRADETNAHRATGALRGARREREPVEPLLLLDSRQGMRELGAAALLVSDPEEPPPALSYHAIVDEDFLLPAGVIAPSRGHHARDRLQPAGVHVSHFNGGGPELGLQNRHGRGAHGGLAFNEAAEAQAGGQEGPLHARAGRSHRLASPRPASTSDEAPQHGRTLPALGMGFSAPPCTSPSPLGP